MEIELVGVNNGKYNVFFIKDDQYIGPCIARGNEWDGWMRSDIEKHYKPETDILDIGANIGYNTLMFSDYGPVHSFEPVYNQIVNKNCQSNSLKNKVSVYPCALSDKEEVKEIFLPTREKVSNTFINYGGTSFHLEDEIQGTSMMVQCARLDDVYKGTPSIIKIDVEGHELSVLEGARETIEKHKPVILIELLPHVEDSKKVRELLKEMGYGEPSERPEAVFVFTHAYT
jgi:FkbM family methyltransferase